MQIAFDTILELEVMAVNAAKTGSTEEYRYECANCSEEVFLAAPHSKKRAPHFRHRTGNNDVKCDEYLGNFGMRNTSTHFRKNNGDRVEVCFNFPDKTFVLGIRLGEDEIQSYEQNSVNFEVRAKESEQPIQDIKINRMYFTPDEPTWVTLNKYSPAYYLSNSYNRITRKYDVFNNEIPSFFKVLGNDRYGRAKLVRGKSLYTNVEYLVIMQKECIKRSSLGTVQLEERFSFETMGRFFTGFSLRIKEKTQKVAAWLGLWGYTLETSEQVTIVWPPTPMIDGEYSVDSECVFLYSSFEIQPQRNINLRSECITGLQNKITKILVDNRAKVFRRNAEVVVRRKKRNVESFKEINIITESVDTFTVTDDSMCFIFSSEGVTPLSKGQSIILSLGCIIKQYSNGYLERIFKPRDFAGQKGEELLDDVLAHYKRTETINEEWDIPVQHSERIKEYLKQCISTKRINSAVKNYIGEGIL